MLLDLAPEIQYQIMQFCPPGALSSLAMVHTSLRYAAEQILYTHVCFHGHERRDRIISNWVLKENLSLAHTFVANPWKAGMVKTLVIKFAAGTTRLTVLQEREDLKAFHSFLVMLSEALQHMPNLVDLCILQDMVMYRDSDVFQESLTQFSQATRFVLRTDHCYLMVTFRPCTGAVTLSFIRYVCITLMI